MHDNKENEVSLTGRGNTPYNGLYGDAPPERDTYLRLEVYKRVEISRVDVQKRQGKLPQPELNKEYYCLVNINSGNA